MKILADIHIHSDNSFDAESSVRDICLSAIKKDLSVIAITDHMEAPEIKLGDRSVFGNLMKQIERSVKDSEVCAAEFSDKLSVLRGMELGEPMHEPKLTRKAMSIADFDFVLASVHNIMDTEDFYYLEYSSANVPVLLDKYFNELYDTAENADFDSLAHLTYPLRYIVERTDIKVDLEKYSELIDGILSALVKREKALEINTSGLFNNLGVTMPDIDVIKRFKELGGKYVTLGSDAHKADNVGRGIEKGVEAARLCGFEHFTVFEKRRPRMIEIWY